MFIGTIPEYLRRYDVFIQRTLRQYRSSVTDEESASLHECGGRQVLPHTRSLGPQIQQRKTYMDRKSSREAEVDDLFVERQPIRGLESKLPTDVSDITFASDKFYSVNRMSRSSCLHFPLELTEHQLNSNNVPELINDQFIKPSSPLTFLCPPSQVIVRSSPYQESIVVDSGNHRNQRHPVRTTAQSNDGDQTKITNYYHHKTLSSLPPHPYASSWKRRNNNQEMMQLPPDHQVVVQQPVALLQTHRLVHNHVSPSTNPYYHKCIFYYHACIFYYRACIL